MGKRKSFRKLIMLGMLFIFLIIVIFIISYNESIKTPLKSSGNSIVIEVNEGEGFYDVLNKLDAANELNNKFLIKFNLAIDKRNINLIPGIYELSTNIDLDGLIDTLQNKEASNVVKLTIPEGYTIDDIGEKIEEKGLCSKEEFIDAVENYTLPSFVKDNKNKRYKLEGYLYPDTYLVNKDTNVNDIIKLMLNTFEQMLKKAQDETNIKVDDVDVEKIITIASLIEKEASVEKDRPLISSVIYNRLDKDMKLQIDASVIYALGYHVDVVLNKHLQIDSPYNVYKYKGLPAGPIANPGIESIKAALAPAKTDYLYYILQKDDSHYFTNSYEDFLKKKKELGY